MSDMAGWVGAGPCAVTAFASVLLAPNPGPMTLDGTNTWVLRAPGHQDCVVVDPGPDDPRHLTAVADVGPVAMILLTHGHPDHSDGARALHELTGAPVCAFDPAHRLGSHGLAAGDVVAAAGVEVHVLATPGHTSDSLSFLLPGGGRDGPPEVAGKIGEACRRHPPKSPAESAQPAGDGGKPGRRETSDGSRAAVLTGDTILGRGTAMVAHPDGRLADYLDSLRRLRELGDATVLPGHGPVLPDAGLAAEAYLAHRHARLDHVRAALAAAGETAAEAVPADVVRVVYADVDRALWPAAELSVRAQLDYLRHHG